MACAKQNEAVKTANDACSLCANLYITQSSRTTPEFIDFNFKEVIKSFLVWNVYITLFFAVDCTVLQEYWRVTSWKYSHSNRAQTCSSYVAGF